MSRNQRQRKANREKTQAEQQTDAGIQAALHQAEQQENQQQAMHMLDLQRMKSAVMGYDVQITAAFYGRVVGEKFLTADAGIVKKRVAQENQAAGKERREPNPDNIEKPTPEEVMAHVDCELIAEASLLAVERYLEWRGLIGPPPEESGDEQSEEESPDANHSQSDLVLP